MKLLFDTHIWVWSVLKPEKLSRRVAGALQSPRNELWLSPVSVWELVMLVEKGRVVLTKNVDEWVDAAIKQASLIVEPSCFDWI